MIIYHRQLKMRRNSSFQNYTFRTFTYTLSGFEEFLFFGTKATSKTNNIKICDFTYLLSYVVTCE